MAKTLAEWVEAYRDDPEYVAEGLVLEFAESMLARAEELGISQSELGRRMGVSPAYVSKILHGANISLLTVAKIAVALQAEPSIGLQARGERAGARARTSTKEFGAARVLGLGGLPSGERGKTEGQEVGRAA